MPTLDRASQCHQQFVIEHSQGTLGTGTVSWCCSIYRNAKGRWSFHSPKKRIKIGCQWDTEMECLLPQARVCLRVTPSQMPAFRLACVTRNPFRLLRCWNASPMRPLATRSARSLAGFWQRGWLHGVPEVCLGLRGSQRTWLSGHAAGVSPRTRVLLLTLGSRMVQESRAERRWLSTWHQPWHPFLVHPQEVFPPTYLQRCCDAEAPPSPSPLRRVPT